MLQGVGDELVQDEAARHCLLDRDFDFVGFDRQLGRRVERAEEQRREGARVVAEVDARQVRGVVQLLVHERHGSHAVHRLLECGLRRGSFDARRLKREEARDDLQVVFYAVVNLAEQRLFFAQRIGERGLHAVSLREITHRQNGCLRRGRRRRRDADLG